jgi:hypothetical protein
MCHTYIGALLVDQRLKLLLCQERQPGHTALDIESVPATLGASTAKRISQITRGHHMPVRVVIVVRHSTCWSPDCVNIPAVGMYGHSL